MRQTLLLHPSPCPLIPFASIIVNHTASPPTIICSGSNRNNFNRVNPILHGEIDAIITCANILGPDARWADLSLYTNAEACPMCAAAIRWAGFKEYIFGTSIETLIERGWKQITISSEEVFRRSELLGTDTAIIGGVLRNETDRLFAWQWDGDGECPRGCGRTAGGGMCEPVPVEGGEL
ncbi:hypothetical protein K440DRAFT_541085 [Wilcoxina mikolae CBS 423.85]|nr:hypothetical protein K440DRAFT_541085 [Wilcoxina mikolae CBS 423.85]